MNRSRLPLVLCVGLFLPGCIIKNDQQAQTETPGGDSVADGGGDAGSDAASPKASRARKSTSTRGLGSRKGGKIKPAGPIRDGLIVGVARPAGGGGGDTAVTSFEPSLAPAGTYVEIFGSGFNAEAGKNKVTSGGQTWEVVEAYEDRLIAVAPAGGNGTINVNGADTDAEITVLDAGDGFLTPAASLNGLLGSAYQFSSVDGDMPDYGGDAMGTYAMSSIDVESSGRGLNGDGPWGLALKGSLNVTEEAEYNLCTNSSDGSQLYLMDTLVVDNSGQHAAEEKCELVFLEAGEYDIELRYFHASDNPPVLQLKWATDDGATSVIPAENLFRPNTRAE